MSNEDEGLLRGTHRDGTDDLATTVALLRAGVDDDNEALRSLVLGLDEDDDARGLTVYLVMIGAAALRRAESGRLGAHAALDSLAALLREEVPG